MAKPRLRVCADGRIGWPDVVQYELLDGPGAGTRLTCPPTMARDLDPKSRRAPTAAERRTGAFQGWEGMQDRTYPYRVVVHDRAAYERLLCGGDIDNRRHTGAGRAQDNRAAVEA